MLLFLTFVLPFEFNRIEMLKAYFFLLLGIYLPSFLIAQSYDICGDGIDNDNDSFIDDKDDDEFGLPRESAIKIASKQITESIINNIISTW